MAGRMALICCALLLIGCPSKPDGTLPRPESAFGRFDGKVVATWDDAGRDMTLVEDFTYVDPSDKQWHAPAGSIVNGASIPKAFWSIIGGPFEGPYRNASVVHDVGCNEMTESWRDVHRMFYDACRCGGVSESKAKMMYWAVYHFGPRWGEEAAESPAMEMSEDGIAAPLMPMAASPSMRVAPFELSPSLLNDEDVVAQAMEYFASNNPSLDEIEDLEF